jgi:hypothetical protein
MLNNPTKHNDACRSDPAGSTGQTWAALAGLLVLLFGPPLLPPDASANPKSEFPNPLCSPSDPNCVCPGGPTSNFCILQLRINNPKYVHMKLLGDWELTNVRQGSWQFEARPGETIYINRSRDGLTSFGVQFCQTTTFGSDCSAWATETLQEPSQNQLAFCQDYADQAAAAQKQNLKLNCGYTGPRWETKSKDNYNACAGSPTAALWPNETTGRANDLQACVTKINTPPPPPKNFSGAFQVSMLPLGDFVFNMSQNGNAINGTMANADPKNNGTLQGTVESDNSHVTFTFVQPQINQSGHGRFWLELTLDHLAGRYFIDGRDPVFLLDGTRK